VKGSALSRRFRIGAALPLCLLATACTGWRPVTTPAPGPVRQARVTSVENAVLVLRDVQVTADSVIGWHQVLTDPLQAGHRQRIAMHRSQVRTFEQSATEPARTGLLAVLIAAAVALIQYLDGLAI
jgi:hypothetical protein